MISSLGRVGSASLRALKTDQFTYDLNVWCSWKQLLSLFVPWAVVW